MRSPLALSPWLTSTNTTNSSATYLHTVVSEDRSLRALYIQRLRNYVEAAHDDARRHLHTLAGDSLDPFEDTPQVIYPDYPKILDSLTLQGYFGEILAAIFAENYAPHGLDKWEVPAFLFCIHDAAFDQLETHRQTGRLPRRIPGQSGDDCLAFIRNDDGHIVSCLVCESKCSTDHDAGLIQDAHANISRSEPKPVSVRKVLQILRDRSDDDSKRWLDSLQNFWIGDAVPSYKRLDLVLYACGRRPVRKATWIPSTSPHPAYTAPRELHAVEIYFDDVTDLIREIYDSN